jgi:hypothetical protein
MHKQLAQKKCKKNLKKPERKPILYTLVFFQKRKKFLAYFMGRNKKALINKENFFGVFCILSAVALWLIF